MTRWFHRPWKTTTTDTIAAASSTKKNHRRTLSDIITQAQYIQHYRVDGEIGSGSCGIVHLALDRKTNSQVAIKEISKSRLRRQQYNDLMRLGGPRARTADAVPAESGQNENRSATSSQEKLGFDTKRRKMMDSAVSINEIEILKTLGHKNVVRLLQVIDDPDTDSIYLVMDLAKQGPIMQIAGPGQSVEPLPESKCHDYFCQLVQAVDYLHSQNVVHRDIKPDNLLLTDNGTLVMVDFGSAVRTDGDVATARCASGGTPAFTAPELLTRASRLSPPPPPTAADIWAMGVTLYCLSFGHLPYAKQTIPDLYDEIKHASVSYRPDTDKDLVNLLDGMLTKDPLKRITLGDIKKHPWVLTNS